MSDRVRVLIVDDSAFTRKVLREVLERHGAFEVVGIARDGLEALEKIDELSPDVVTLDLIMPNLDGVGVLRALPAASRPGVLIVSTSDGDTELAAEALQLGAVDLVRKPTALATERLYELDSELTAKALVAAHARPLVGAPASTPLPDTAARAGHADVVVVGTSTGGPQALTRLLTRLPADLPAAVAVALHIPIGYTEALARRLDEACAIDVVEASDGLELRPGLVVLARGGAHLTLERSGRRVSAHIGAVSGVARPYCPSVDLLFESAAAAYGSRVLGVVLTGMGEDGLQGSRAIVTAGGVVLTEAASSCIVYGMPRAVFDAGLSVAPVALDELAAELVRRV
jgi:two-component system chemotaxis response regulator CheB